MNVQRHPLTLAIFYACSAVFDAVILFTGIGNYFHGGTPAELIALQAAAVVLCAIAVRLFLHTSKWQRMAVVLASLLPLIVVIGSAWSSILYLRW
jgi:heme/copper-type cytochrome/quinol oxidase subunit 4